MGLSTPRDWPSPTPPSQAPGPTPVQWTGSCNQACPVPTLPPLPTSATPYSALSQLVRWPRKQFKPIMWYFCIQCLCFSVYAVLDFWDLCMWWRKPTPLCLILPSWCFMMFHLLFYVHIFVMQGSQRGHFICFSSGFFSLSSTHQNINVFQWC